MDLNTTELRRQLRDADREQKTANRSLREVLKRHFNGERGAMTPEDKAAFLGIEGGARRSFLRASGLAVVGGIALAACGDDDGGVAETGTTAAGGAGTTTGGGEAPEGNLDLVLARTAAATEIAAVAAYQAAIDSGVVSTQAVADAAVLFQSHHQEHAGLLNGAVTQLGGEEVTEPLPAAVDLLGSADLSTELKIVQFARALEDIAAGTYVFAAGVLSTPDLRQALMSIGGVEARHVTALDLALQSLGEGDGPAFEYGAFYGTANALGEDALLTG